MDESTICVVCGGTAHNGELIECDSGWHHTDFKVCYMVKERDQANPRDIANLMLTRFTVGMPGKQASDTTAKLQLTQDIAFAIREAREGR